MYQFAKKFCLRLFCSSKEKPTLGLVIPLLFEFLLGQILMLLAFLCILRSYSYVRAEVRGLRPANGILLLLWTLQPFLMQWSRFTMIMLVIW